LVEKLDMRFEDPQRSSSVGRAAFRFSPPVFQGSVFAAVG